MSRSGSTRCSPGRSRSPAGWDLPAERVARATELQALLNVEGNFFPNVDDASCFARGIHVLGCGPAYATAVAEYALGLALDLARGISREDRAFRAGREQYVSASTADSILFTGAAVGLVGSQQWVPPYWVLVARAVRLDEPLRELRTFRSRLVAESRKLKSRTTGARGSSRDLLLMTDFDAAAERLRAERQAETRRREEKRAATLAKLDADTAAAVAKMEAEAQAWRDEVAWFVEKARELAGRLCRCVTANSYR